jgi:hypothetical protein
MSHGRIAHRGPVFRIPVHLVTLLGPAGALIGSLRRWPSDCGTLLRPEAFGIRKGRKPALPLYVVSSIGIGAAVHTLHAQAKPPVYMIAINEVSNEEGYSKEYVPAAQKAVAPLLRALGTRNVIPLARRAQGFMSRSIPLQSAYCAPKAAVRGFTDFPWQRAHPRAKPFYRARRRRSRELWAGGRPLRTLSKRWRRPGRSIASWLGKRGTARLQKTRRRRPCS